MSSWSHNDVAQRESNYLSVDLTPQFGKFIIDDLLVGGRIQATFNRSKNEFEGSNISSTGISNQTYYSIGPFIKYFFGDSEKGKPFIDVSSRIGIRRSKLRMEYSDDTSYENQSRETFVNGSASAGYALFLDDSILLSFFLAYTHERLKSERESGGRSSSFEVRDDRKENVIGLGVRLDFTLKKRTK